ncbi:MAG: asparagine synthase (glutamine-hydrolyzing) [Planctomycetota bacterium]
MCGIAGLLHFDPSRAAAREVLDRMTDAVAHRGPDGRGVHLDGPLGLGHRRLSIIDLSDDGLQPMPNEDGTVWVVLNGELYNFRELRAELEAKGHRFRSRTDTEVLVHLYEEHGEGLVERLRGMFAFALWDARARRLLLARDRFGQKPLYLRRDSLGLRFASELKGILADPEVPRAPDPLALHLYLTYGYVPAPRTAFLGIEKLPPGYLMVVEADGRARKRPYWTFRLAPKRPVPSHREERALEEELLAKIDEAVRLRMVADVPLGAFLSGGVDSSAIVASMVAARPSAPVRTFSIGFEEPDYDERAYAREVAEHLGTDHTELVLTADNFVPLETVLRHHDEPFADASALPTFAVSQLARQHVTVALSGDAGDELFLGYGRYLGARVDERVRAAPGPLRALARNPLALGLLSHGGAPVIAGQLSHDAQHAHLSPGELYVTRLEQLQSALKDELYEPGFAFDVRGVDARALVSGLIERSDGETFVERCAHADVLTYLPDDILAKVDIASMACALEARSPFLDHELAELVARLPARLKQRRLVGKRVLKHALVGRVPRRALTRKKQGFGVPLEHWFRGRLDALLRERLLSPEARQRGLFRPAVVERLLDEHRRGVRDHRNALYPLLVLETWFEVCAR